MGDKNGLDLPGDFMPVEGCVPEWIDVKEVCSEAKRFVGLYLVDGFNVVAINNGRNIYTTDDRGGEFRKRFTGAAAEKAKVFAASERDEVLVYDCEDRRQWIAPRNSAVRFLYQQAG
jgi:hypothetical protein